MISLLKPPLREGVLIRGGVLADFLNAVPRSGGQRLKQLIECSLELQKLLDEITRTGAYRVGSSGGTSSVGYCAWGAGKNVGRILQETNRLLDRYRYRRSLPFFLPLTKEGPPAFSVESRSSRSREREYGRFPISESRAVDFLLNLAEWNALGLLRRCPVCQKWFMAGRTDQKLCGIECSKRGYRLRNRATSAAYMRKYRKAKKEQLKRERDKITIGRKGERYAKT